MTSLAIAFMSFIGMVMSFFKLPWYIQYALKKYHLLTDVVVFVFTYLTITMITKTIVGLLSATIIAFMADLAIRFLKLVDNDPEIRTKFYARQESISSFTVRFLKRVL